MKPTFVRNVSALTLALGACLAWPSLASAQSTSNGSGGTGGGFALGQRPGMGSGLGLNGGGSMGSAGSSGSFGGLAPGGSGIGGAQRQGTGMQRPGGGIGSSGSGGQSGSGSTSGGSGNNSGQSIGDELSKGPYSGSRPGGLYAPKQSGQSQAAKAQMASAVASAGISKQYKYSYGAESLGTKASSVYKSPWKSTTDNYQWGATSH